MKIVAGIALTVVGLAALGALALRALPTQDELFCGPGGHSFNWDNFDEQGRWLEGGIGCTYAEGRFKLGTPVTPEDLRLPPVLEAVLNAAKPIIFYGFLR